MNWQKDIRFPEKKVDSGWKDDVSRGQDTGKSASSKDSAPPSKSHDEPKSPQIPDSKTSKPFLNLISSLGFQALLHLGEIPNPETQQTEINLEAAQEVINLLIAIQEKSQGNLSREETQMLSGLVSELQMKFAGKV